MKVFTAHTRPLTAPVLVREGFSWGAAIFGPFWLLAHAAWIGAALTFCVVVAVAALPQPLGLPATLALAWILGLYGQDIRRWSLGRRGFLLAHVVAAPDVDTALARLLDRRPDLTEIAIR